jgi:hypothetical protein
MMFEHSFMQVTVELTDAGLLTAEELTTLVGLIETLRSPDLDLSKSMSSHPSLQLAAGYFSNKLLAMQKEEEGRLEALWYEIYHKVRDAEEGRFSESLVSSRAYRDAKYQQLKVWTRRLEYFANQLKSLHYAFICRARMLEQISNNSRQVARESLEDD